MKHFIIALSLLTAVSLPFGLVRSAAALDIFAGACDEATADSEVCTSSGGNPISGTEGVILRVVSIITFIIGVASVLMVMLGGLKYITANGDANALSSAKNTILYAVIGAAVAMFSRIIVQYVITNI